MDSSRVPEKSPGAAESAQDRVVNSPATAGAAPVPLPSSSPMSPAPASPELTDHNRQQATTPQLPPASGKCHVLTLSVLSLLLIGFCLWLFFSLTSYREKYAQATEGWYVGGTRMVELTLVEQDIHNLACASDQVREGLHCAYRGDQSEFSAAPDDRQVLRPYNTTKNELLLGAGLWSSPAMQQKLPSERFTVVCNYHVVGAIKSVSTRFAPTGNFGPVEQSVAAGTLTECVLP